MFHTFLSLIVSRAVWSSWLTLMLQILLNYARQLGPDGCCNMMQWWEGSGAPPSSVYSHLMCYVWCILVFCIQTVLSSSMDSVVSCADRQQNKAIHLRRLAAGLMSNLCLKSAKHSLPPHHLPAGGGDGVM